MSGARTLRLSLVGILPLALSACGLVLGIPSSDDVTLVGSLDGSVDGTVDAGGDGAPIDGAPGDTGPETDGALGPPEALLTVSTFTPSRLALDGNGRLYFVDYYGKVGAVDLATKNYALIMDLTSGLDYLHDIAADPSWVYFTNYKSTSNSGAVFRCAAAGCPTNMKTIEGTTGYPTDLELDGKTLYVSFYDGVIRKTLDATVASPMWADAVVTSAPDVLRQQGTELFWSGSSATNIYKCSTSGCADNPPAFHTGDVELPILDQTRIYWSERGLNDASTIWALPRGGGAKVMIVDKQPWVYALAADPGTTGYVYFATRLDSKVWRCPKTGCAGTPQLIASAVDAVDIVVDANNAYYSAGTNVYRVKK